MINEIMANPAGSEYTDEFIELVQEDSLGLDLNGWSLDDGEGQDLLLPMGLGEMWLAPGGLAIILDSGYSGAWDELIPPGVLRLTVPDGALCGGGLSNSTPERLRVLDPAGQTVDAVWTRPDLPEAISLERRDPGALCDSCWTASRVEGGTPGLPNSALRRPWEAQAWLDGDRLCVLATGASGCQGNLLLELGKAPCMELRHGGWLNLARGQVWTLTLAEAPLARWNPLRVVLEAEGQDSLILLDTLWLAPARGHLAIEALQPSGDDWVQLRWLDPCPVLLDGLKLEARGFSEELDAWLPADGRLLVGASWPACAVDRHVQQGISLALNGSVWIQAEGGEHLDEAIWPQQPGEGLPWRRLELFRPGDEVDNWREDPSLLPGCAPHELGGAPPTSAAWSLDRRLVRPGRAGQELVVARQAQGGAWFLRIYSLEGEELLSRQGVGSVVCWGGELPEGGRVAGLVLLRLESQAGVGLFPVAVAP